MYIFFWLSNIDLRFLFISHEKIAYTNVIRVFPYFTADDRHTVEYLTYTLVAPYFL